MAIIPQKSYERGVDDEPVQGRVLSQTELEEFDALFRRSQKFPAARPRRISRKEAAKVFRVPASAVTAPVLEASYSPADILTPEQLAERLQVTKGWIKEKTRSRNRNKIPSLSLGRYIRFHWPDVCRWLQANSKAGQ